ncbi:11853_t:CDS:2 [Funneliformis geosporum]|nr:11853_t:CDS:2 [Funneliformis geosporum]
MNNTNDSTINIPPSIDVSSKLQKNKSSNNLIANFIPRAIFLFSVAFISLYIIIYLVQSIPNLSLPTSIEGVKLQAMILDHYSSETWQAGALYGPLLATLMTSSLAAIGASCAYLISKFLGQPIMDQYLSDKLNYLRKQVNDNRDGLFFYLLFIRMFPLSPWWLLNLASPLLYIPLGTFFTSMFFGSISYNLACCQAGEILSELSSTNEIWQPLLLFKMILVSLISLFPPLYTRRYKRLQNNVKSTNDPSTEFLILKTEQDVV